MTKTDLRRYRYLKADSAYIRDKIAELDAQMLGAAKLTGQPRGSGKSDPVAALALRRAALTDLYQAKLTEALDEQERIERAVSRLPDKERQVLRAYYLDGLTWEMVCLRTGYSWAHVHRLHASGLSLLATR